MTATVPQFHGVLHEMGSDVTFHREGVGTLCPCLSPEGFRQPKFHQQAQPDLSAPTFAAAVLGLAPVGYWKMDDAAGSVNALDSSGHAKTLAKTGGVTFDQAPLIAEGRSAAFAGATVALRRDDSALAFDAKKPYTVEAWVYPTTVAFGAGGRQIMVGYWDDGGANAYGYNLTIEAGILRWIRYNGPGEEIAAYNSMVADTRYHIVAVYDGSNLKLYVNNVLRDTVASPAGVPAPLAPMFFSVGGNGGLAAFQGRIDDTVVYDKALSPAQINDHYLLGTPGVLNGSYHYKVTFINAAGECGASYETAAVNPVNQQVQLTSIPIGPPGTTARKVYRRKGTGAYGSVTIINDNTTKTYLDNLADGGVGGTLPPAVCNEQGRVAAAVTEVLVKAAVQPASPKNTRGFRAERMNSLLGDIERDDHIGIFPVTWQGVALDFDDWSVSGEDFIVYDNRRFTVVSSDKVPDVDGDPNHHWEVGLRLIKMERPV